MRINMLNIHVYYYDCNPSLNVRIISLGAAAYIMANYACVYVIYVYTS